MNARAPFDDGNGHEPPSADLLAGEYVLGVLDADARRQAQARIDAEPAFARLVADWEARFAGWLAAIAPVDAPMHVWPRIRSRLGWSPVASASGGVWHDLRFWRGATAAALAIAAALAVVALLPSTAPVAPQPAPPVVVVAPPVEPEAQPKPVVVLAREDGSPGWLAAIDQTAGAVTMTPVPAPADPQGRVAELWLIPPGGAPQSLGLVSGEKAHTVEIPAPLRDALASGATLAITLEPKAGIPHPAPTGPIIAKGTLGAS